jgi:cyclopropane-fatty-acyl-phospholipid synthase
MLAKLALRRLFALGTGKAPRYRVQLTFADGSTVKLFHNPPALAPDIHIVFKTRAAERHAAVNFYAGLFDAYIAEEVDILGHRPIAKLAELGHEALGSRRPKNPLYGLLARNPIVRLKQILQEARQSNDDVARAKQNAIYHYGIASEFFEYLLGDTVGYSEGYWPAGTNSLNRAKVNNYDYVARKLRLEPGLKVVEVGAGWGYMPLLMARTYGADVTVYNPVPRQNDYMRARFARHGMGERIKVLERDHCDLRSEPETYDRYVSIGVYEHVGKDGYRDWIESIAVALKPGGIGVLSTTTKMVRAMTEYLTLKYVFPGGHLPSLPLTLTMMDRFDLTVLDLENLWPHYQRTVAHWRDNLKDDWPQIQALDPAVFNERFRRIWTMYLEGTTETFQSGLDLFHIVFVKGRDASLYPLTRDFLYPRTEARELAELELYR